MFLSRGATGARLLSCLVRDGARSTICKTLVRVLERGNMKFRTSWRAKLADRKDLPKVQLITGKMSTRWGKGSVVISAPVEVDALMRKVSKGKLINMTEIREALARKHCASIACPITSGIFALIVARAAAEDEAEGNTTVTPYWCTLKGADELNPKFPGGVEVLKARLEAEGHQVVTKGKKFLVLDYINRLATLTVHS